MIAPTTPLTIGLVDFADPTLLIVGDTPSLEWFASQLENNEALDLAYSPKVRLNGVALRLHPSASLSDLSRRGDQVVWTISRSDAHRFADMLRGLASSHEPAHAYLDPETNPAGLQIVASKDEYNPAKVFAATH